MKARQQLAGWSLKLAPVFAAACLGVPGIASAAGGGTIHFTGMIVAPPFDINQSTGAPQNALVTLSNDKERSAAHAVTVTYAPEPNSAPVAEVWLAVPAGANSESPGTTRLPVDARFTDAAGHSLKVGKDGVYHVNGMGGVLTLVPGSGSMTGESTLVTVVTRYQ